LAGAVADVRAAGLASGSFFLATTFDFDAAGLLAGVVLRAGVFAAVLMVVFVALWLF
jgi:hypothetical protein